MKIIHNKLSEVITTSLKIGMIGFGGGSALIPVIEKESVLKKGFLSEEQFIEYAITSNLTPGAVPTKLCAAIGSHVSGISGMFAAAFAFAMPGTLITLFILSALSLLKPSFLTYVSFASIGVNAFILTIIFSFIFKVVQKSLKCSFGKQAIIIICVTAFSTYGQEIRTLLSYFAFTIPNIIKNPLLDVPTIDLLIVALFIIAGTSDNCKNVRSAFAIAFSVFFLISAGDMNLISQRVLIWFRVFIIMSIFLAIVFDAQSNKPSVGGINLKKPLLQSVPFVLVSLVTILLSILLVPDVPSYILKSIFSTLTTFGGGPAFITVADGIFAESGFISSGDFYGKVLPVANALPGPLVIKILAGIGFLKGFQAAGTAGGFILAIAGASTGIAASIISFAFVHEIYKKFSQIRLFKILNLWMLPVVCGLLVSTVLSMLNDSLRVFQSSGISPALSLTAIIVSFALIYVMQKKMKIPDILVIILIAFIMLAFIYFTQK